MNKKSFCLGCLSGIVLTFVALLAISKFVQDSEDYVPPIQYIENPVSYEDKTETSFKVFQVLDNAALPSEISDKKLDLYFGNTVMILGDNYYDDQIVTVKNPLRIGTYSYTTKRGMPKTVPVIDWNIE